MAEDRGPNRRRKKRKRRSNVPQIGAPPGILLIDPEAPRPRLRAFGYGPEGHEEQAACSLADLDRLKAKYPVVWLDVVGLGDELLLRAIAERFNIHPLALEDITQTHQRPKLERYGDDLFIVARMIFSPEDGIDIEQVSLFLGDGFVVSFQEREADVFEPVRERVRRGSGRIRGRGADYLAYALLDAVVDAVFPTLEYVGNELERIELGLLSDPDQRALEEIQFHKRDLLNVRRAIWPLRDALSAVLREEGGRISDDTRLYLRDTSDHTVQLVELVESQRELCNSLVDLYMNAVSQRMNEIMKVLTLIATLFMPLSFIAGLYGMNFDTKYPANMPELRWPYGYPFAIGMMALIAIAFVIYFRRKKWI
ncbi:MAG: magnesium/cobalt transporter CorA [Polyangiales bacterium]